MPTNEQFKKKCKAASAQVSRRLEAKRKELGYSYQDLADKTGMSKVGAWNILTGTTTEPPLWHVLALAHVLHIDVKTIDFFTPVYPLSNTSPDKV
jgi:transcriptional regulator with XRE-family HTH domain